MRPLKLYDTVLLSAKSLESGEDVFARGMDVNFNSYYSILYYYS